MKFLKITSIILVLILLLLGVFYVLKKPRYSIQTEGKLYVLNKASKSITIFDLYKGEHIKELPVKLEPHEATLVPNPNRIVITDYGTTGQEGKSITVINANTDQVENTIDLGLGLKPHGIMTMPYGHKVGVVSDVGNHLSIVNIDKGIVEKQIATEQDFSHLVVHHPFKPIAYVTNINSGSVSVIDVDRGVLVKIIPCSKKTEGIAIAPNGAELWVTNILENTISVINTETYEITETLATGKQPLRLKFSKEGKQCLVSNSVDGTVSIFDAKLKKEMAKIQLPGKENFLKKLMFGTPRPVGILMHPNGIYAFISNHSAARVEIIDMRAYCWVSSIQVGEMPDGLALIN